MLTDTVTPALPGTLEYRGDEHALHPFQRIVLICAAIGAAGAACYSAIPMAAQFARTGWPLRYTDLWLAHELTHICVRLVCVAAIVTFLSSQLSRRVMRAIIVATFIALLSVDAVFLVNESRLHYGWTATIAVGELSHVAFDFAKWILLLAVFAILAPRRREQPARAWSSAFLAAIASQLLIVFCDGFNIWALALDDSNFMPLRYKLAQYACGGCLSAVILTTLAWRWSARNQRLLCALAIVFLVTPRTFNVIEFRYPSLPEAALRLLAWQVAIAAPLIAVVWMSHRAQRESRDARCEI